ncbi:MAG: cupredoxin domain-containing protein [Dehalococcoidales bacterium]|nr:cupredoxin domain-containing protein [Dehalococcoidales bacterium]
MNTKSRRRLQDWHHMLAMCLVMALISGGLAFIFLRIDFIPHPASVERGLIDNFMKMLFAIAAVFFGVIITVLAYAIIFFRQPPGDDTDARPITGNPPLEIVWTVIPLAIVIALGIYGAVVLDKMTVQSTKTTTQQSMFSLGAVIPANIPPSGVNQAALEINVTASRFAWEFEYPSYGITAYILKVPVNQTIVFNIKSKDVVHSFWVQPWGPKQDAVPGLSPDLRITPTEIGQYLVECSQLCGFDHSDMTAPVQVVSSADFEAWVKQQKTSTTTTPTGSHTMVDLVAHNLTFDKSSINVPPGSLVEINFNNQDNNISHNFAVYTDSSATIPIFVGQIISGPKTITYTFTAPTMPGKYYFRCDVHPTMMVGTFTVQ